MNMSPSKAVVEGGRAASLNPLCPPAECVIFTADYKRQLDD